MGNAFFFCGFLGYMNIRLWYIQRYKARNIFCLILKITRTQTKRQMQTDARQGERQIGRQTHSMLIKHTSQEMSSTYVTIIKGWKTAADTV